MTKTVPTALVKGNEPHSADGFWADFSTQPLISTPTHKNKATWLVDGMGAMKHIAMRIREAKKFVWIAGWAITPGVRLDRNTPATTLATLLEEVANPKPPATGQIGRPPPLPKTPVPVRILLWDSVDKSPMDLSDRGVEKDLEAIPNVRVLRHRPGLFWSHHQKMVVVDGEWALLGGIDLYQGRWDTPEHELELMDARHVANRLLADEVSRKPAGRFDTYNPNWREAMDEKSAAFKGIPRMPWHDVHVEIGGPAASCVARNFAQRWRHHNKAHRELDEAARQAAAKLALAGAGGLVGAQLGDDVAKKLAKDLGENPSADVIRVFADGTSQGFGTDVEPDVPEPKDILLAGASNGKQAVQIVRSMSPASGGEQTEASIHDAYLRMIKGAHHYIYIENQYFISKNPRIGSKRVQNRIVQAIVGKVDYMARNFPKEPFHVVIVVPIHPEGVLRQMSPYEPIDPQTMRDLLNRLRQIHSLARRTREQIDSVLRQVTEKVPESIRTFIEEVGAAAEKVREKLDALWTWGAGGAVTQAIRDGAAALAGRLLRWWNGDGQGPSEKDEAAGALWNLGNILDDVMAFVGDNFDPTHGSTLVQLETLRYLAAKIETAAKLAGKGRKDYLSIYYLRAKKEPSSSSLPPISEKLFTEQIYIHAKIMIVDDDVAIIGSANINDRSMLGDRDTEIAAVIVDEDTFDAGVGTHEVRVRRFARDLRIELWKEHFGQTFSNPLKGISTMQKIGSENAKIFLEVFPGLPSDEKRKLQTHKPESLSADLAHAKRLKQVTGHAVEFPLRWLEEEMLTIPEDAFSDSFTDNRGKPMPVA